MLRNKKDLDMSQEIHCVNTIHFGSESAVRKPQTEVGSRGLGIGVCKQCLQLQPTDDVEERGKVQMDDPGPFDQSVRFMEIKHHSAGEEFVFLLSRRHQREAV